MVSIVLRRWVSCLCCASSLHRLPWCWSSIVGVTWDIIVSMCLINWYFASSFLFICSSTVRCRSILTHRKCLPVLRLLRSAIDTPLSLCGLLLTALLRLESFNLYLLITLSQRKLLFSHLDWKATSLFFLVCSVLVTLWFLYKLSAKHDRR